MKSPLILLIDANWYHHLHTNWYVAPEVALCFHEQLAIEIVILRRQYADKHTFNFEVCTCFYIYCLGLCCRLFGLGSAYCCAVVCHQTSKLYTVEKAGDLR